MMRFRHILVASIVIPIPVAVAQRIELSLPDTGKTMLTLSHTSGGSDFADSIQIEAAGRRSTIQPRNPIARIPATKEEQTASGLWANISGLQLGASRFFFRSEYANASVTHTLLFFVGTAGASDAAPLLIVGFRKDGSPYKVLEREQLDMTSFRVLPDGTAAITGKTTLSEAMGCLSESASSHAPSATTYDPYSVFIVRPEQKAIYSLAASERYNRLHYVWAGPHSREDYVVVHDLPGHKKLFAMPTSQLGDRLACPKQESLAR